jgi:CRISPR-associated endonuclease/helicase Cas3
VALALYKLGAPSGVFIHLCVYHSQFPLLIRSNIELQLDQALNRRWPDRSQTEPVFDLPDVRQRIDAYAELDHVFIVLGSPVTEVGRDHDYDWAIVEPSSMRSLIQLAGRIRRHRDGECTTPNLLVFDTNFAHFRKPGKPAFCRPGFENIEFPLDTHSMTQLLSAEQRDAIDARPRIVAPIEPLQPRTRLVDLEHARMRQTMLVQVASAATVVPGGRRRPTASSEAFILNAATWWQLPPADALLGAVLQKQTPFREDRIPKVDLLLRLSDDCDGYELVQLMDKPNGRPGEKLFSPIEKSQHHRIPEADVHGNGIAPWGQPDYLEAINDLADELDITPADCALRFGTVTLPTNINGWRFHPALGFSKWREP